MDNTQDSQPPTIPPFVASNGSALTPLQIENWKNLHPWMRGLSDFEIEQLRDMLQKKVDVQRDGSASSSKSKRPRRRKCAYCGKYGLASEMVGTPTGIYRSECHMAHKKCRDEVMTPNAPGERPGQEARELKP